MKIFSAAQIKEWDRFTISNKPISSLDLMERAAAKCADWVLQNIPHNKKIIIICGSGNNGGDGLAIARMLLKKRGDVAVYILKAGKRSNDCNTNLQRLIEMGVSINEIETTESFPAANTGDVIIEAMFGTGLNKPLQGIAQLLAQYINQKKAVTVISIDMPAGLYADKCSKGNTITKAAHTLSFQCNKLAFMMAENSEYTGNIAILDIGLDNDFYNDTASNVNTIDKDLLLSFFKARKQFAHKYSFGHALLFAGSQNMMGAAILAAESCLRSGAGLVTVHIAEPLMPVIQTALPEAIASAEDNFETLAKKKAAIGIGPGLAINETNTKLLGQIITEWAGATVIDASALSMLQPFTSLLAKRKEHPAILTPHTGEFEKLFGQCKNDFERMDTALQKAAQLNCYVVLKGRHTLIACPNGEAWFNTTGNNGMATAGSGDVLTGILTGLLAQGYTEKEACLLGVYLHGLAGNFAAASLSPEAMIAGDITNNLGNAFKTFY